MSAGLLFGMGVLVTILVAVGVALPIYGAILDGREQSAREAAHVSELSTKRSGHRPAA